MERNPLLAAALQAVTAASNSARYVQQRQRQLATLSKDDASPVTAADFAAQAIVALILRRTESDLLLVGEEQSAALRREENAALRDLVVDAVGTVHHDVGEDEVLAAIDAGRHDASAEAYWTLDPIDGTKGFLRHGQYAISLARIEQGQVTLGVLGCPSLSTDFRRPFDLPDPSGLVFYATRGGGTWVIPADRPNAMPTRVWPPGRLPDAPVRVCESVESAHSDQSASARIYARLGVTGAPARLDSQCKYAVVARGQADCYLRLPTRSDYIEKIWDHAAGMLVAQEAGAIVTDVTGAALDFTHGRGLVHNRGIVCAAATLHGRLLDALRELDLS